MSAQVSDSKTRPLGIMPSLSGTEGCCIFRARKRDVGPGLRAAGRRSEGEDFQDFDPSCVSGSQRVCERVRHAQACTSPIH